MKFYRGIFFVFYISLISLYGATTVPYQDEQNNSQSAQLSFSFSNLPGASAIQSNQSNESVQRSTPIATNSKNSKKSDMGFSLQNLIQNTTVASSSSENSSNTVASTLQQAQQDQTSLEKKTEAAYQAEQQKQMALELDSSYSAAIAKLYEQGLSEQYNVVMQAITNKTVVLADLQEVVSGYEEVVTDFVQGYNNVGMAITATSSCYAYTTCKILMNLYAALFSYQLQQVALLSDVAKKLTQYQAQVLSQYGICTASLAKLFVLFPKDIVVLLTASWQKNCAQSLATSVQVLLEQLAVASSLDVDIAALAVVSNFVINFGAQDTVIPGYTSYAEYVLACVQLIEKIYLQQIKNSGQKISLLTSSLFDNKEKYHQIVRLYHTLLMLYRVVQNRKDLDFSIDQQKLLDQKIKFYSAQEDEQRIFLERIFSDKALMQGMQVTFSSVQKIVVNSQALLTQVQDQFAILAQLENSCQQSLAWYQKYQALDDQNSVDLFLARIQYLHHQLAIKCLWLLFMQDSAQGLGLLTKVSLLVTEKSDPDFAQHAKQLAGMCAYFNQMMQHNIVATRNAGQNYTQYITKSLSLYAQDLPALLSEMHLKYTAPTQAGVGQYAQDMQTDQALVQVLNLYEQLFVSLYYGIEYAQQQNVQDVFIVQAYIYQIINLAQKIDALYEHTPEVANYIPQVLSNSIKSMSLQQLMGALCAYVLVHNAQATQDSLVCVTFMQLALFFKNYMAQDIVTLAHQTIEQQISDVDMVSRLQSLSDQAFDVANWKTQQEHTASSNIAAQNLLLLYQIAGAIAPADQQPALQKAYEKSLKKYLNAYTTVLALVDQHDADLVWIYYQLYQFYVYTKKGTELAQAQAWLQNYISNTKKSGIFDQLQHAVTAYMNPAAQVDFQTLAQTVTSCMKQLDVLCQQQTWYAQACRAMYLHDKLYPELSKKELYDAQGLLSSTTYQVVWDAKQVDSLQVTIPNLSDQMVVQLQKGADAYVIDAHKAEATKDFVTAAQKYTIAYQMYQSAVVQPIQDVAVQQKIQATLGQVKSCLIAASNAALVATSKVTTVAQITDVPLLYSLQTFALNVPQDVAVSVPESFQNVVGKQNVPATSAMLADAQRLYTLALVDAYLSAQGYTYTQCFTDAKLTPQTGVAPDVTSVAEQAVAWVQLVMQQQKNISYAITITPDLQITITAHDVLIPPLHPWYAKAPYANLYFASAYALYKPGNQSLGGGAATFAPGNNPAAAAILQKMMNNCLLATAYNHAQQAAQQAQDLQKSIQAALKKSLDLDFSAYTQAYQAIKNNYQIAFAALTDSSTGAIAVFTKQGLTAQAAQVQAYALSLYGQYIVYLQSLLIGNPTSSWYAAVLLDITIGYTAQKKIAPSAKAAMNKAIADIFMNAGDACMQYMSGALQPAMSQVASLPTYEYAQAVPNYIAAYDAYTKLADSTHAAQAEQAKYRAYAYAIGQNLAEYMYVRTNGIMYQNAITNQNVAISFAQLLTDYAQFENQYGFSSSAMDPNEMQSYHTVKKLLLDALSMIPVVTAAKKEDAVKKSSDATTQGVQEAVNTYITNTLQLPLVGSGATSTPNFKDQATIFSLLAHALDGVRAFDGHMQKTAAWLNYLMQAADQLYFIDFLGATTNSSAQEIANDYTLLSQALQAEGTSLQNPASAYIG